MLYFVSEKESVCSPHEAAEGRAFTRPGLDGVRHLAGHVAREQVPVRVDEDIAVPEAFVEDVQQAQEACVVLGAAGSFCEHVTLAQRGAEHVWHLSTPQNLLYLLHQPPCHGQHVHASGKRPVKICALDSIILHILPGATAARQRGTLFAGAHEATRGMPHEGSGAMAHGTAGYGRLWRREVQCACGV